MKGNTVRGLYKEAYGQYEGKFIADEHHVFITTDRYFEKYVLLTDDGIYEIWAGGIKRKDDILINDFQIVPEFEMMNGLVIENIKTIEEKSLIIYFETKQYFEVGLCPEFNNYNHPERYMKLVKTTSDFKI